MIKKIIYLVLLVLALTGCNAKSINVESTSGSANTTTQIPNTSSKEPNITAPKVQNTPGSTTEFPDNIKKYFSLTKDELIKQLGGNFQKITTSIEKSSMIFPAVYYKDIGLTFVFGIDDGSSNPQYIIVNKETNIKEINIKGAMPEMSFEEVQKKLGETKINETWISTKDKVAFEIHYLIDGLTYKFVSIYQDGRASQLIITDW